MNSDGDSPASVFTKDLCEHLRTVHFSLLATVFVLLVASSLRPAAELERATSEAAIVAGLNASLTSDKIAQVIEPLLSDLPQDALSVHERRNHMAWKVEDVFHRLSENVRPLPRPRFWIPLETNAFSPPFSVPSSLGTDPDRRTLRQFRDAWTFLLNSAQGFVVSRVIPASASFGYARDANAPGSLPVFAEEITDRVNDLAQLDPVRDFLTEVRVEKSSGTSDYRAVIMIQGGQTVDPHLRYGREARIPLETKPVAIELLPGFLNSAGVSKELTPQQARAFDEVFRNLTEFSKGLESLTIGELQSYLNRLRTEKGVEVELYGARIPQKAISGWGLCVLVTLQLYLLAHLSQLASIRRDYGSVPTFPWVALYSDGMSLGIALGSMLLPPLAGIIVIARGWSSMDGAWLRTLVIFAQFNSVAVSVLLVQQLRQIQKRN